MANYKYNGKYKDFIQYWGKKEDCEEYERKIDQWLEQFDDDEKGLELELLKHFQLYRGKYLDEKIGCLYQKFLDEIDWAKQVNNFYSIDVFSGRLGNSTQFHFNFRKVTNYEVFYIDSNNIEDVIQYSGQKIAFVDDYSGSGESFIENIDLLINMKAEFRSFEIAFLVVNISKLALMNIKEYAEINSLNIKLIYCDLSLKAFSSDYIFNKDSYILKREEYFDLCKKLNLIVYPFGYNETEALIAFDSCIPNNNIATFRDKKDNYKPLFFRQRLNISDFSRRQKEKKMQYNKGYLYKNTCALCDFKTVLFVIYCYRKGKQLNMSEACEIFGMTAGQFNKKLDYCVENAFLIKGENKYEIKRAFYDLLKSKFKSIKEILFNIIEGEIIIEDLEYRDIIKYTPLDFDNRFSGYKGVKS